MKDWTLITPESGAFLIEDCSIFNHPRIRGRYRSSHLCRLLVDRYVSVSLMAGYLERHETPGNASTASPDSGQVNGSRTSNVAEALRHACVTVTSRDVTLDLGGVQALPWSCLITEPSVKAHGMRTRTARIVHAPSNVGGLGSRETGTLSTAGRSQNFPHPQFTGRPWPMTSGGVLTAWRALIFPDRPLNPLSINVQKKGSAYAQKTQPKPTGFLGGSTC
ncbi:hypothetical protein LMG26691_04496 [Achromobacter animicus]|nr:hypothetical protein LMG26691_04496 [Achromobacter animicus]